VINQPQDKYHFPPKLNQEKINGTKSEKNGGNKM